MEQKSIGITLQYALIQSFFWITFAAIQSFCSVYLLDCGLSNTQIGIVMAVGGCLAALLQPVVGSYADRPSAPSMRVIVAVLSGAATAVALVIWLANGRSLPVTAVFYAMSIVLLTLLMPFINALGTEKLRQGTFLNLGLARSAGSAAFAIVSWALGLIVASTGVRAVPIAITLGFGLLMVVVLLYPFQKDVKAAQRSSDAQPAPSGPLAFFRKYPRFTVMLVGAIFVYVAYVMIHNYIYQIVVAKGGGSAEMGSIMSLCAILELPTLLLFTTLLRRAGSDVWLRVGVVFITLKTIAVWLAPSVGMLYWVQLLQMLGWALVTIAPVYYVTNVVRPEDSIKGQAYMSMTYALGTVLAALIGGWLLDLGGTSALMRFATISSIVGTVVVLLSSERLSK